MFVAATVTGYLDLLYVGWKLWGFEGFGYISAEMFGYISNWKYGNLT